MIAQTHRPPALTPTDAERIVQELYGMTAQATLLPGEHDRNFRMQADAGMFLLRVAHAAEDPALVAMQTAALVFLAEHAPQLPLQRPVPTRAGELVVAITAPDGDQHMLRLLTYLPGVLFAESRPHRPELLDLLGWTLGETDRVLLDFDHPAAARDLKWDLTRALAARTALEAVADPQRRMLVAAVLDRFEHEVVPQLPTMRRSIIHNDANDYNLLVAGNGTPNPHISLIDFGDMLRTITVAELAIACAYAMLDKPDPLAAAAAIITGYNRALPLTDQELDLLDILIRARLAVSVINSSYQQASNPEHTYMQISARPAWALLEQLASIDPTWATGVYRHAAGRAPWPAGLALVAWLQHNQARIAPVLQPDPRTSQTITLDLSVGSQALGNVPDFSDPLRMDAAVVQHMHEQGASVAIGRYNEARPIYRTSLFQVETNEGPEWRSIHIGLDLFAPAGTPVYAPLDGVVVGLRDNAAALDYGPTIILQHVFVDAPPFYSLYGHLGREALANLRIGQDVRAGQPIATIGDHTVNGGWAPHLHLQLMLGMLGRDGEFPGVARPSERELWTAFCPDPGLLLGLSPATIPGEPLATPAILELRRERIGYNLSVSYREPLQIVRGYMQHLYDTDGRQYLDSVNNVPHVGHQHPHVVRAAQRQIAVLNTNTRYLHSELVRYAERLTSYLPDPLKVCFFTCSGSEATELALRLARAHTHQRDLIVSDGAYHGNTTTLIEISPYKSEGPGGTGLAPWVHKAPMPDTYRGPHHGDDGEAGMKYARMIEPILARIKAEGRGISAFIIESLLSCGGQIVLPPGYLQEVYRLVRAAGGICIADEVQVGFGRVGSHFWGFETQAVVPDIVAMGKPIGNGFPLGAVVTTPAIAASFDNGMEYFNTYGGNPVACVVGQAVLDVIEQEQLQHNALQVGSHMLRGLDELKQRHQLIGDVRGQGLMLGFELVRDRATREPADWEASYIANRMRDHGILFSTDGPLHNVIKIKPPLVYTASDADRLVTTLDTVLHEDRIARRP